MTCSAPREYQQSRGEAQTGINAGGGICAFCGINKVGKFFTDDAQLEETLKTALFPLLRGTRGLAGVSGVGLFAIPNQPGNSGVLQQGHREGHVSQLVTRDTPIVQQLPDLLKWMVGINGRRCGFKTRRNTRGATTMVPSPRYRRRASKYAPSAAVWVQKEDGRSSRAALVGNLKVNISEGTWFHVGPDRPNFQAGGEPKVAETKPRRRVFASRNN